MRDVVWREASQPSRGFTTARAVRDLAEQLDEASDDNTQHLAAVLLRKLSRSVAEECERRLKYNSTQLKIQGQGQGFWTEARRNGWIKLEAAAFTEAAPFGLWDAKAATAGRSSPAS